MKNALINWLFLGMLVVMCTTSCKTEYEKVRTSGNADLIYKKAYEYYEEGRYVKSQGLFELVIPSYRGKKELEDIYFKYADTYFQDKQYLLSAYYYKNFSTTFPNSEKREEAEFMSAFSNYNISPNPKLDQIATTKAIEDFQLYINTFPESPRVADANRLIDELRIKLEQKALNEAELYYNLRQYRAAVLSGQNLLKEFPETKNGEYIRYLLVKANFNWAENSVIGKQQERYENVKKFAGEFQKKYNKSEYKAEVSQMLEKSLSKIKSLNDERYKNKSSRS